jgi:hypothetical protein
VPAAPKISAQAEATILARHAAGEPLRAIAPDHGVSHQALSKRLRRARERQAQQPQPQLAAEPADERGPAIEPPQLAGPSPAAPVAGVNRSHCDSRHGLVRLRRGNEACWVDPVAESARHQQLLAEGFTA